MSQGKIKSVVLHRTSNICSRACSFGGVLLSVWSTWTEVWTADTLETQLKWTGCNPGGSMPCHVLNCTGGFSSLLSSFPAHTTSEWLYLANGSKTCWNGSTQSCCNIYISHSTILYLLAALWAKFMKKSVDDWNFFQWTIVLNLTIIASLTF